MTTLPKEIEEALEAFAVTYMHANDMNATHYASVTEGRRLDEEHAAADAHLRALLATLAADAARYAYCRKGQWMRRKEVVRIEGTGADERVIEEEWTFLLVRVPNGANMSCSLLVDDAIDAARATP